MGMATTWQTATDREILCLPSCISSSVTARNLICQCLSLPLCNSVLFPITPNAMGSLLYSRFRSHVLLAGRAAPGPDPWLDEINGNFTTTFSNCRINLQAQCNRNNSKFKAMLTTVTVLMWATYLRCLKCISEDKLSFLLVFFPFLFFKWMPQALFQ